MKSMKKFSTHKNSMSTHKKSIRDKIIGLGEGSARKSYYPQLLENIRELREERAKLIETVHTLEEREKELEKLVEEKTVLLEEVHHRVKNNFQIITSLLNLGRNAALLPSEAASFSETSRRIQLMAQVYERMLHSGMLAKIDICELLRYIGTDAYNFFKRNRVITNYAIKADRVYCGVDMATPLALAVNEVISLLYTHSFSDSPGEVNIELVPDSQPGSSAAGRYTIRVFDTGPGIAESTKNVLERQLGVVLIRNLCFQIGGSYEYIPSATGNYNIIFSIVLHKDQAA